ncbi:interferon beta-like [Sceloporus undulatus]|uniref:interferon beta-like n=1 Tax=Sceloporus undulatus TaxID=8520 RepID=UPI001C4B2827|nr:interferon beta-like [Sceloporus undulatus]
MVKRKDMVQRCNQHQGICPKNPPSRFCTAANIYIPSIAVMITKSCLLHFCLMMFFFIEILSEGCGDLHNKLQEANKANLELLNTKMGSTIPLQCVDDVINFSSNPNEENLPSIYEFEEQNATVAIDEILQQILYLFNQNHSKLSWDENSITIFKVGVEQEIGKLTPCLNERMDELRGKVKRYFERVNDLLKNKDYSLCAWEIVQMEVRQCLIVIDQLITRLPKEAPVIVVEVNEKDEDTDTNTDTDTDTDTEEKKEPETPGPCTPQGNSNAEPKQDTQPAINLPAVIDTVLEAQRQQLNDVAT